MSQVKVAKRKKKAAAMAAATKLRNKECGTEDLYSKKERKNKEVYKSLRQGFIIWQKHLYNYSGQWKVMD